MKFDITVLIETKTVLIETKTLHSCTMTSPTLVPSSMTIAIQYNNSSLTSEELDDGVFFYFYLVLYKC